MKPIDASAAAATLSRFNRVVARADKRNVLFNLRSGGVAEIDASTARLLTAGTLPTNLAVVGALRAIGAIVETDELQEMEQGYQARRLTGSSLPLTIAPTLDCNFACDYCYQDAYRNGRAMTDEVADALLLFVDKELERRESTHLKVTWYGGEPLLQLDRVLSLMNKLREVTSARGVRFPTASIITNGLLLTEACAKQLRAAGVGRAQISIDALHYDSGKKRGAILLGSKALSPILENVISARSHIDIQIRVNTSKSNEQDLPAIMSVLRDNGLADISYMARVEDADGESGYQTLSDGTRSPNTSNFRGIPIVIRDPNLLSRKDVARLEIQHFFSDAADGLSRSIEKLQTKRHFCSATTGELAVIDPSGDISRCWHSAGVTSESVGSVLDVASASDAQNRIKDAWLTYSPFRYKACTSCDVLPLCMGGCSHPRVLLGSAHTPCEAIKYQIRDALEVVGNALELPTE